jgi:hypothetical protein
MLNTVKSKIQIEKKDDQLNRDNYDPIPPTSFVWIISGKKGTGKSTLLLNVLDTKKKVGGLKKRFDKIYMISPTAEHDPKFKKLVVELKNSDRFFDTPDNKTFNGILESLQENGDQNSLLILDDCADRLPKSTDLSLLNRLVILSRHYKLCIIITSQKYNKVNPMIRTNADLISFCRTDNKKEFKTLDEDLNTDADKLKRAYDFSTDKNNFLHVNMYTNPITMYKNFDRIVF